MGKRLILISSCWEEESLITSNLDKSLEVKCTDSSHYPLGIAYLHSFLESKGHDVHSLWLNNHPYEYGLSLINHTIQEFKPDIIGFQILTPNRVSSFQLIEYIHNNYPNLIIIIGGIHATIMYEQILEKYPTIIAILGEGEITFNNLIRELSNDEPNLTNVKGIAFFHDKVGVIKNPDQDLIENLDILPFPKHELFINNKRTTACILTSRGCPNNCSFCCLNSLNKRKVRYRSVENVIDEINSILNKHPQINKIYIHDDTFFLNSKKVIDFCNLVISNNISVNFICSGRFKPISYDLVKKLEKANFIQVLLGLESGDEEILRKCHKGITQNDVIHAVKLFANSNIDLYAFLIVGLPGETHSTIVTTGLFVQKLQRLKYIYYDNVAILTVYPGTEIYYLAKKDGIINDDYWLSKKTTPLFTVEHNLDELLLLKESLLDYISYDRLFSKKGFIKQFSMIPTIVKYRVKIYMKNNYSLYKILKLKLVSYKKKISITRNK